MFEPRTVQSVASRYTDRAVPACNFASVCRIIVERGYSVMKGTEYFVSLQANVLVTEECNVMVNSEELIGTTEYLTL